MAKSRDPAIITPAHLRIISAIGGGNHNHSRRTLTSLARRGLVDYTDGIDGVCRLTAAGRAILAEEAAKKAEAERERLARQCVCGLTFGEHRLTFGEHQRQRFQSPDDVYRLVWTRALDIAGDAGLFRLPDYQRGYVWDAEQARALIETMLLGLPVGSIILREMPDGTALVIDGQQRISTLIGMSLGRGGDVPTICIEPGTGDVACRAVVGAGSGRVPVSMLSGNDRGQAVWAAAAGLDPSAVDLGAVYGIESCIDWHVRLERGADMLRYAALPSLVFRRRATDAQVVEAFRRTNLCGTPISADEVERLIAEAGE